MPQETIRKVQTKRFLQDRADQSVYVDIPIITEIRFNNPSKQNQMEIWRLLADDTATSRKVHVSTVYNQGVTPPLLSFDLADVPADPTDATKGDGDKIDVERIESFRTVDASEFNQGYTRRIATADVGGNPIEPPVHRKTHLRTYTTPPNVDPATADAWIQVQEIDEILFIDAGDRNQGSIYALNNPLTEADLDIPVDGVEPTSQLIDPPWRLDPFKEIVDVSWGGDNLVVITYNNPKDSGGGGDTQIFLVYTVPPPQGQSPYGVTPVPAADLASFLATEPLEVVGIVAQSSTGGTNSAQIFITTDGANYHQVIAPSLLALPHCISGYVCFDRNNKTFFITAEETGTTGGNLNAYILKSIDGKAWSTTFHGPGNFGYGGPVPPQCFTKRGPPVPDSNPPKPQGVIIAGSVVSTNDGTTWHDGTPPPPYVSNVTKWTTAPTDNTPPISYMVTQTIDNKLQFTNTANGEIFTSTPPTHLTSAPPNWIFPYIVLSGNGLFVAGDFYTKDGHVWTPIPYPVGGNYSPNGNGNACGLAFLKGKFVLAFVSSDGSRGNVATSKDLTHWTARTLCQNGWPPGSGEFITLAACASGKVKVVN